MAIVMYRCQSCGGVHEASLRPAGGAVYLRCIVTRGWAWHEPSAFLMGEPAAGRPASRPARKAAATRGAPASKPVSRRPAARAAARPKRAAPKRRKH